jgi:chromodomain-helicase-DNA-binding protein 4
MTRGRHNTRKPDLPGMVNWSSLQVSSSGESSSEELGRPRRRRGRQASPEVESDIEVISSDNNEQNVSDESEIGGRRSLRQKENKVRRFFQKEAAGLSDGGLDAPSRSRRLPVRSSKKRVKYSEDPPVKDESKPGRRSSRTRTRPSRSMRERQEDDISAYSEEDVGPKVVATKEVFPKLPKDYPFRRRHRPECDTCFQKGDDERKGILVYCQGCTNSHHKVCLGTRSTREHLVTKVAEGNFVLQCRRCIGIAKTKDHTAPHLGHCEECHEPGVFSKPLRTRLTTKQEQQQREDNGGRDPITIVDMSTVNNNTNVMFRCTTCQRGWHMHHLPARQMNMRSNDDDREDEELNEQELAERRFDYYHRGWVCKDCVENQSLIDALVAWRPVDHESYIPGHRVEMMEESKKEYLVKWKSQSYFRTQWMPGSWVWGTSTGSMRAAFMKKDENSLPKMTTKDAIPEEFFRIDIVFQVRYSSIVRNPSMEIDFLRAKEVESAYVKYKGLGYEDAIWEVPPKSSDTDRFKDYQDAYECYVMGLHTNIPPQSSLRRHLSTIRADPQNFQTAMMMKIQPSTITGGQMMAYQVEGLNWLYYRWFQQHNCILADEMGLGKTIQLIAFFATMVQDHKCWPFLVVVPNSTCPNWRREIRKWAPSLRVVTYYGSAHARKLAHDYELFPKTEEEKEKEKKDSKGSRKKGEVKDIHAHIVVASYDSVVEEKTRQSLMRVPWQGLVVDEGQRLKNDKNLIYDSLSKFRFPFKCLLTGTPLQNNARELFNLLQFLDPKISASAMEAKFETLTKENVPELHELIRPFFLRRTKAQVLTFLPPMAQIILPVTMSTVQKKVYKSILAKNPQLMKSIFTRDAPVAMKEKTNLNNILMQLRKTLCHPFVYSRQIEERSQETNVSHRNLVEASSKLQLLQIMLPKLQERGHRVLIFSQFLDNLDIIEDFLDGLGLQYRRLDGSMSSLEKQKRIDEFNAPDSPYFAFLLSTRSGGVGINLATADTVLIIDPDFNPHQDIQALSRAHRIGQKKKVLCFQIMTRGSAEEKIMQIGKKKMALDHVMIQEMDREDEAGMDLESILRHGAEALFDDDNTGDIVYDSASVDKLLDRSQIESTNTGNDSSAESQFSFARIWANDKASLEDTLEDSGTSTPNPGIWDKILKERERAYAEESARNKEAFGRGKRKRHTVDYHDQDGADPDFSSPAKNVQKQASGSASDTDFQAPLEESEDEMSGVEDTEFNPRNEVEVRPQPGPNTPPTAPKVVQPMMKGRQFARVKVPTGLAPNFNNDGAADYIHFGDLPPSHNCSACHEKHPMGWCRLKIAGVEHCNLCGLSHLGHEETCPHLKSEIQIGILLRQLKESTESKELVDKATAHLKAIKAELVKKKVAAEVQRVSAGIGTVNRAAPGLNGNVDRRSVHAMQMHTADWRRRDLLGSNTSSQVGNDVNGTSSSIRGSTQH